MGQAEQLALLQMGGRGVPQTKRIGEQTTSLVTSYSVLGFFNRTIIFFHMDIDCNCASHIPIAAHN